VPGFGAPAVAGASASERRSTVTATRLEPTDPPVRSLATAVGPLAVTDEGGPDAPVLLCVHGIPGSRRDFRYLAPWLAERFRVIRLEMPGFGGSPAGATSLHGWAEALLAAADALAAPRVGLVAHSFGGGAALLAAPRLGDRLGGVASLAGMAHRRHRAFVVPPWAFAVLARALGVPAVGGPVVRAARGVYRSNGLPEPAAGDTAVIRLHLRLLASVRFAEVAAAARTITAPVLVAHAEDDRLVEPALARELAALLPAGRLEMFPSGGHHLNKTRAAELGPILTAFFAELA